jgi:DNA topoisomerase I
MYVDPAGRRVADPATLRRIRELAIPPAWRDVWICPAPNGHIQAVGLDAKGRRQYRYHDVWRLHRDREKFDRMLIFARSLPRLRKRVDALLAGDGFGRERVLACAIKLLDVGFFRIGTEDYAEENDTYGLATMLKRHVSLAGDEVRFDYTSKGGKRRVQAVVDEEVANIVAELKGRRAGGPQLFAYRDDSEAWTRVHSDDINEFLREQSGADCTAKDFRTWSATVLAAVALAVSRRARSEPARRRCVTRAMKEVAVYLGNTPAVARKSYVDPRIIDLYMEGRTIAPTSESLARLSGDGPIIHGAVERAVRQLLEQDDAEAAGRAYAARRSA